MINKQKKLTAEWDEHNCDVLTEADLALYLKNQSLPTCNQIPIYLAPAVQHYLKCL